MITLETITTGLSLTGLDPTGIGSVIAVVPIADGAPLFPERRAYTVNYQLSDLEAALYEAVTDYVKTEMGKADQLDGKRKGSFGFALTALQRRLASSPEAIFQSLKRRRERLERRLREEKMGARDQQILAETLADVPEDDDDLNAEEQENLEETLVDQATASRTIAELAGEIIILQVLEQQAKALVVSGKDRKWDELSRILQNEPQMYDAGGRMRKIIIFSEHRDTLNYLHEKIAGVLGSHDAIVVIHGAVHREHLMTILNRDALAQESLSPERLFAVKEEMEKAEARRLQPYFVRSFFMKGFETLGGSIYPRESDRFIKLTDDKAAGKDVRLNLENVRRTLSDLEARLESRKTANSLNPDILK